MKIKIGKLGRLAYGVAALALTGAALLPALTGKAFAYGLVTDRSVQMSSSTPSASSTSYLVNFKAATAGAIQGIVVDFCSNNPIIGDSCTAPTSFSVGTPTVSGVTVTGMSGGTWSAGQANTNRTLTLTNGSATGSVSSGGQITFTLTTATNPSTTGSFYARIFTFATSAAVTTWTGTTNGSSTTGVVDAGGVALSTAAVISLTARVQETLSFCVYPDDNGGGAGTGTCGDNPSITLGHAVGSATVIDDSAVDTALVNFRLSTNAQSGAVVDLKGDTLKSGTNDINAAGASAVAFSAGTEKFGVRLSTSGTNITATAPYNGASNNYGFDTTSTTSTYGDQLCALSGPTNNSVSALTYAATAALTTSAGAYTASHQLIATGTF